MCTNSKVATCCLPFCAREACIQVALSSRAALGLLAAFDQPLGRVRHASKGILHTNAKRALWLYTRYPILALALGLTAALGRVRARAKVSCIQALRPTLRAKIRGCNVRYFTYQFLIFDVTYAYLRIKLVLLKNIEIWRSYGPRAFSSFFI